MYIELLDKNPLSIQPILATQLGLFTNNGIEVKYGMVSSFPAFDMTKVDANVGDTTRIFERLTNGEDLVITSDLTRTMKLMLCDDYKAKQKLRILSSGDQSLGIYTEFFAQKAGIEFEYVIERNIQNRLKMIRRGEVDGACMIDPFLFEFIGEGYHIAYEGKCHPYNYTCWAFHRSFINANPGFVDKFHKSLNQATDIWNAMPKQEKLNFARKHLDVANHLFDYYRNLQFVHDKEYDREALIACYEWKRRKSPEVAGLDLAEVIYKW